MPFKIQNALKNKTMNNSIFAIYYHLAGENDILAWMNDTLQAHGSETVSSFKDLRLSSAVPLLKLLYAIEPKRVNWAIIHEHPTDNEQKELNAKYVLSVARALGAYTFITFEDIVQVKPKLIMTLVASIMAQANSVQNKPYATSFVSYKTPNQVHWVQFISYLFDFLYRIFLKYVFLSRKQLPILLSMPIQVRERENFKNSFMKG